MEEILTGTPNERQTVIAQKRLLVLNDRYFDGILRDYKVVVMKNFCINSSPIAGQHRGEETTIYINAGIRGKYLTVLLLHEMAHASTNDYHAEKWLQEIERVANAVDDEWVADALRRDLEFYRI
jgi:hypothetical protein